MIVFYLQYLLLITKGVYPLVLHLVFFCDIIIILKTRRHDNDAEDEEATAAVIKSFIRHFSELIVLTPLFWYHK